MARRHDDSVVQERLLELLKNVTDAAGSDGAAGRVLAEAVARDRVFSQSLVNQVKNRHKPVSAEFAVAIALNQGVSLDELYQIGPPPWSRLPGWDVAEAQARALFPRVRAAAFERVAAIRAPAPDELDAAKIGLLASMYDKKVSDA